MVNCGVSSQAHSHNNTLFKQALALHACMCGCVCSLRLRWRERLYACANNTHTHTHLREQQVRCHFICTLFCSPWLLPSKALHSTLDERFLFQQVAASAGICATAPNTQHPPPPPEPHPSITPCSMMHRAAYKVKPKNKSTKLVAFSTYFNCIQFAAIWKTIDDGVLHVLHELIDYMGLSTFKGYLI